MKHSGLLVFVETARQDARRYVSLIDDIKNHLQNPPAHAPTVEPRIPEITRLLYFAIILFLRYVALTLT